MSSSARMSALVVSRREVTGDLWIMRLRPEDRVSFQPGQYVAVGLPAQDRIIERPYSIASAPQDPELEFFLERVPGGELSPQLYDVPVGGRVWVRRQAKGRLVLERGSGRPNHFMVATVTGVAPFVSIVRSLAADAAAGAEVHYRVALLQAAAVSDELGYREELTGYTRTHAWFHYVPTVSRPWLDPDWRFERGRAEDVARKHLDALGFTPADTTAYLCGNPHMVANLKGVLFRAGFPKEAVKEELYWVTA